MIVPYFKTGESRTIITEDNDCYRVLEARFSQYFSENANVDFIFYRAALQKAKRDRAWTKGNDQDRKSILLRANDRDIYVEVEIMDGSEGKYHWKTIVMNAYRTATSEIIKSFAGESGRFQYSDCLPLINKVLMQNEEPMGNFARELGDIDEPDLSVSIDFSIKDAPVDYMIKLEDGRRLFQAIEEIIEKHSSSPQVVSDVSSKAILFRRVSYGTGGVNGGKNRNATDFVIAILDDLDALRPVDGSELNWSFDQSSGNIYFVLQG